jgi:hypothetical protein
MCKNYNGLLFHHFIVAADGSIFASGREGGIVYNFLIRSDGQVRTQNGTDWYELAPAVAAIVRNRVEEFYGRIPTYRIPRFEFN